MGAFGELLIQHWGGDLDKYRGNTNQPKKEIVELSEQEKLNEKIKTRYEYKIKYARKLLSVLTNQIMYQPHIVNLIDKELFMFSFKQNGYDLNISNLMWKEYNEFIKKYVNK